MIVDDPLHLSGTFLLHRAPRAAKTKVSSFPFVPLYSLHFNIFIAETLHGITVQQKGCGEDTAEEAASPPSKHKDLYLLQLSVPSFSLLPPLLLLYRIPLTPLLTSRPPFIFSASHLLPHLSLPPLSL